MPNDIAPLPTRTNADGAARRTGVEIEFANLTEAEAARVLADSLDGTARQGGDHDWRVEGSAIGDVQVYLDTALRREGGSALREAGLKLSRDIVPVELVSEPLDHDGLVRLDAARAALREAGAEGSRAGLAYGFGVHLNVEVTGLDARGVTRPLLAYALIEDWMRRTQPIDAARRVLPFTAPYPTDLARALAEAGPDAAPETVMRHYLDIAPDRNHGLDMLPLFACIDEEAVTRATAHDKAAKARPTFHFRLPDCRIDEADWSLADPWDRWLMVERIAENADLLERLRREWLDDHGRFTLSRSHWAGRAGDILQDEGVVPSEDKGEAA